MYIYVYLYMYIYIYMKTFKLFYKKTCKYGQHNTSGSEKNLFLLQYYFCRRRHRHGTWDQGHGTRGGPGTWDPGTRGD